MKGRQRVECREGGRGRGERLIVEHAASFLPECSHWCGGGRCGEGEESGQETSL